MVFVFLKEQKRTLSVTLAPSGSNPSTSIYLARIPPSHPDEIRLGLERRTWKPKQTTNKSRRAFVEPVTQGAPLWRLTTRCNDLDLRLTIILDKIYFTSNLAIARILTFLEDCRHMVIDIF